MFSPVKMFGGVFYETFIKFIRLASYNSKCFYVGKPNSYFVKSAIKYLQLNKKNIVLIGDQLETDILAANNTKISSILVMVALFQFVNPSSPDQ